MSFIIDEEEFSSVRAFAAVHFVYRARVWVQDYATQEVRAQQAIFCSREESAKPTRLTERWATNWLPNAWNLQKLSTSFGLLWGTAKLVFRPPLLRFQDSSVRRPFSVGFYPENNSWLPGHCSFKTFGVGIEPNTLRFLCSAPADWAMEDVAKVQS